MPLKLLKHFLFILFCRLKASIHALLYHLTTTIHSIVDFASTTTLTDMIAAEREATSDGVN